MIQNVIKKFIGREMSISSDKEKIEAAKYRAASKIADRALNVVLSQCKPKARISDICIAGDDFITEQTEKANNNVPPIISGLAFPTSVSLNNNPQCHYLPYVDYDDTVLEKGDIVKIDLGCIIGGVFAVVAHTHVLQDCPVTGRATDVVAVAFTSSLVALRIKEPEHMNLDVYEAIRKANEGQEKQIVIAETKNLDVYEEIRKAAEAFIAEGAVSGQEKQIVIDGTKVLIAVFNPDTRVGHAELNVKYFQLSKFQHLGYSLN